MGNGEQLVFCRRLDVLGSWELWGRNHWLDIWVTQCAHNADRAGARRYTLMV